MYASISPLRGGYEFWNKVMIRLDFNYIIPPTLFHHWERWSGEARNKRIQNGHRFIWHATIWSIWKARYDKIFKNGTIQIEDSGGN